MLNQTINYKNLHLLKGKTIAKFNKGRDSEFAFNEAFEKVKSKLSDDNFNFSNFKSSYINGKVSYDCSNPEDELVLKKLNDNIKRLFKVKTSDRHSIVKQTISLLKDSQPISIIRLDIKNFYEEIDRSKIIKYVHDEWLLSHQNRMILKSFNENTFLQNHTGVPRGLSISSTLAELGLRNFDSKIRKVKGIYYYARFVDDIIIFCTKNPKLIFDEASNILNKLDLNLEFNEKTYIFNSNDIKNEFEHIDYLGYKIHFETKPNNDKPRCVKVQISDKKIKKIKARINKSFRSYNRTRTFELLESRIKFLTANQYIIGDIDRTKLKSGIYYNYPLITTRHQLRKLDNYYQELLKSNRPHMLKALKMIKKHNKKEGKKKQTRYERLKKLSFTFGYEKRVMNSFNRKMSRKIKGCW